jgi:hypothetical protein
VAWYAVLLLSGLTVVATLVAEDGGTNATVDVKKAFEKSIRFSKKSLRGDVIVLKKMNNATQSNKVRRQSI